MTGKKAVLLVAGTLVLGLLAAKIVNFVIEYLQPNRLPSRDWAIYQENFISKEGRVIDTGNGNISHSEGQGYGLVIAEAYSDRYAFDRIWDWTQKNLQTRPNDKLLCWLWKPDASGEGGAVSDPNNASDGDLLVAWALMRAHRQWGDYKYQQAAAQILTDLAKLDVVALKNEGTVMLPGTVGFDENGVITVNLSYYVFPAFRDLAAAFPGGPWAELSQGGRDLLHRGSFGKFHLPPDWLQITGAAHAPLVTESAVAPTFVEGAKHPTAAPSPATEPTPAAAPETAPSPAAEAPVVAEATATPASEAHVPTHEPAAFVAEGTPAPEATPGESAPVVPAATEEAPATAAATPAPTENFPDAKIAVSSKFPPDFGYNAVRIPLHLAWEDRNSPELVPFADFWKQFPPDKIPATVNVVNDTFGPDPVLPGVQAIAALTIACVDKQDLTVRSLPVLTKGEPYFSSSLSILTKIAVRELSAK